MNKKNVIEIEGLPEGEITEYGPGTVGVWRDGKLMILLPKQCIWNLRIATPKEIVGFLTQ